MKRRMNLLSAVCLSACLLVSAAPAPSVTAMASEAQTEKDRFEDSTEWKRFVQSIDDSWGGTHDYSVKYVPEERRAYVFFAIDSSPASVVYGCRTSSDVKQAWDNMLDSFGTTAKSSSAYIDTSTAGYDSGVEEGGCSFVLLESVKSGDDYDGDDILAVVTEDGTVYDVVSDEPEEAEKYLPGGGGSSDDASSSSAVSSESGSSAPSGSSSPGAATTGERNALGKAEDYLRDISFSYSGLIDQLEYEGFTTSEATYAADRCGADWNEQALLGAQSYLRSSAFSYSGLIDQLEFEGFTAEQATYGADRCGADWNEQALLGAQNYLRASAYSYSGLIDQLEFDGFTAEQAAYGADRCGADWNEQASKKAEEYLNHSSFSRSDLISQLEFEGFTSAQAQYGASQNGY